MAFGFSVGDVIAALGVVSDVISSLRDSGGAGEEYRQLIQELQMLETALTKVKQLEIDEVQLEDRIGLFAAATHCQSTLEGFIRKIQPYQPHLRLHGSTSKIKDVYMKIKWGSCKKEEVERLRTCLHGDRQTISMLLGALQ